jgi:hypothetical protein
MRSGRESYGESAIDYVQLKREGHINTVLSCVSPEHKVTSNGYKVEIVVDSSKGEITSCKCYGCIVALGRCKHQLALLGWMHRRFEDQTPTEKACYWKKSKLSNVGKTIKFILVKDLEVNQRRKNRCKKKNKLSAETIQKRKPNRKIYKMKSKINVRKDPDGVSFLQEIIAHMDWKFKKGNEKVIPELAKISIPCRGTSKKEIRRRQMFLISYVSANLA